MQGLDAAAQFFQDVVNAIQVFQRAGQLALGFLLAHAESADARRFFKHLAAILTFIGQDIVDTTLADIGIAVLAHAGIVEKLLDILESAGGFIEIVFAVAVAVQPAGDGHLGKLGFQRAILVVKHQRNLGVGQLFALFGAVEDDVLHAAAAQLTGVLLAQHPLDRVADIAFARSIGADDAGDAAVKDHLGALREGLEAVNFQLFQLHLVSSAARRRLSASPAAACSARFLLFPLPRPAS